MHERRTPPLTPSVEASALERLKAAPTLEACERCLVELKALADSSPEKMKNAVGHPQYLASLVGMVNSENISLDGRMIALALLMLDSNEIPNTLILQRLQKQSDRGFAIVAARHFADKLAVHRDGAPVTRNTFIEDLLENAEQHRQQIEADGAAGERVERHLEGIRSVFSALRAIDPKIAAAGADRFLNSLTVEVRTVAAESLGSSGALALASLPRLEALSREIGSVIGYRPAADFFAAAQEAMQMITYDFVTTFERGAGPPVDEDTLRNIRLWALARSNAHCSFAVDEYLKRLGPRSSP